MKILFLAQFPIDSNKGGVQRVTSILSFEFQSLGHTVFYCSTDTKRIKNLMASEQQFYLGTDKLNELVELVKHLGINVVINQAGVYAEITNLLRGLKKAAPTVKLLTVHHNCIACLNECYKEIILGNPGMANKVLRFVGNPLLWSVLRYRNRIKYKRLFQDSIDVSDRLVLLAESYRSELCELRVDDKGKVQAISNPASFTPQISSLSRKENRIVYVGRLYFVQKRVDKLMNIIEKLHQKHQDWHFDIVGDGPQREWMEEYRSNNQLDRVYFHGFANPKPFLNIAKVLLLTSDYEGFGMVIPEAQAYGVVPVVTPCFSAVHEVIGKNAGIVVNDLHTKTIIEAVDNLINSPQLINDLSKGALKNVGNFNPNYIGIQWLELIEYLNEKK